jgi:hypothetical protein
MTRPTSHREHAGSLKRDPIPELAEHARQLRRHSSSAHTNSAVRAALHWEKR